MKITKRGDATVLVGNPGDFVCFTRTDRGFRTEHSRIYFNDPAKAPDLGFVQLPVDHKVEIIVRPLTSEELKKRTKVKPTPAEKTMTDVSKLSLEEQQELLEKLENGNV